MYKEGLMQNETTFEDVGNAFWDWQCWWLIAKSTGEVEDLRAMTLAGLEYSKLSQDFLSKHPDMNIDERELFDRFTTEYARFISEEDNSSESEAER